MEKRYDKSCSDRRPHFLQEEIMVENLKILTQKEFEESIKCIVREKKLNSIIDAIVMYCEKNKIEIETAASLITPRMKGLIESEAIKNKMIKSKKAKLPIS